MNVTGCVRLALAALIATVVAGAGPARADDATRAYVKRIDDRATWLSYSRQIGTDRFGKFIIDVDTDEIYFIDVNLFRIHADFVLDVLLEQAWTADNIAAYNRNYERDKPQFILGSVTHHLEIDRWTFAFWEGDDIDAAGVERVARRLSETFFVDDLPFRPASPAQERVARRVARRGVPVLTSDEIYKAAPYQSLHHGTAVGRLRVVPRGTAQGELLFEPGDIVLLQQSYPDIPPVAGILSSRPSTPLSHVNLRARAWDVPNASYVHAYRDYQRLDGQVVRYTVTDTGHELRAATAAEIAAARERRTLRRIVRLPPADLAEPRLAMLTHLDRGDVGAYGAKTANLGEIASRAAGVRVPAGFGVPFHYYAAHLRSHGLDRRIASMLTDRRWAEPAWRREALAALRADIAAAPIDPRLLDALYKRVRVRLGHGGVFVRSSTNAEDLEGFNGAGLYDTVPNVRGKEALGEAVKTVWASLWNLRAVQERELYGIDHRQVHAGVLIQTAVEATAAGVLVTDNLYDPEDDDSFTINAKWGLGMRVVEGTRVPEQVVFDTSNDGTKIISRADDPVMLVFDEAGGIREVAPPAGGVILSEARARRLARAAAEVRRLFPWTTPADIEWLLEGETIWIVQARPLVR